jgi:hypothetical protein
MNLSIRSFARRGGAGAGSLAMSQYARCVVSIAHSTTRYISMFARIRKLARYDDTSRIVKHQGS